MAPFSGRRAADRHAGGAPGRPDPQRALPRPPRRHALPAALRAALRRPRARSRSSTRALIKAGPAGPARRAARSRSRGSVEAFTSRGTVDGVVEQARSRCAATYRWPRDGERWTHPAAPTSRCPAPPPGSAPAARDAQRRGDGLPGRGELAELPGRWTVRSGEPVVASRSGNAKVSGDLDSYRAEVQADLTPARCRPGQLDPRRRGRPGPLPLRHASRATCSRPHRGRGEVTWEPAGALEPPLRGQGIDPGQLRPSFPGTSPSRRHAGADGRGRAGRTGRDLPSRREPARPAGGGHRRPAARRRRPQLSRLDLTWSDARLVRLRLGRRRRSTWARPVAAPNLGDRRSRRGAARWPPRGGVSGPTETPRIQADAPTARGLRFGTDRDRRRRRSRPTSTSRRRGRSSSTSARPASSPARRRIEELTVRGRGPRANHEIVAAAGNEQGRAGPGPGRRSADPRRDRLERPDPPARPALRAPIGDWSLTGPAALPASTEAVRLQDFCWQRRSGARALRRRRLGQGRPLERRLHDRRPAAEHASSRSCRPTSRSPATSTARSGARHRLGPGVGARSTCGPARARSASPATKAGRSTFRYEQGVRARPGRGRRPGQRHGPPRARRRRHADRPAEPPPLRRGDAARRASRSPGRIDVNLATSPFSRASSPTSTTRRHPDRRLPALRHHGLARASSARRASAAAGPTCPRLGLELRDLRSSRGRRRQRRPGDRRQRPLGPGHADDHRAGPGVPGPETPVQPRDQRASASRPWTPRRSRVLVSPDLPSSTTASRAERHRRGASSPRPTSRSRSAAEGAGRGLRRRGLRQRRGGRRRRSKRLAVCGAGAVHPRQRRRDQRPRAQGRSRPARCWSIEEPGKVTRGTGELELKDGTFKAYGQDLTIERGRLIFAGGPLSNPGVDLRAFRKADDGTVAGIDARGTLAKPEVTLWSEPPMAQSEQLSYLLLGRPSEPGLARGGQPPGQRRHTRSACAAATCWPRSSPPATASKRRASRSDGSLDQASLVVGKYLSPRLYVTYGIGLFEAGQHLPHPLSAERQVDAAGRERRGNERRRPLHGRARRQEKTAEKEAVGARRRAPLQPLADRLREILAPRGTQGLVVDAEMSFRLCKGQRGIDQAQLVGQLVRVAGEQDLVAPGHPAGDELVDVADDVGGAGVGQAVVVLGLCRAVRLARRSMLTNICSIRSRGARTG